MAILNGNRTGSALVGSSGSQMHNKSWRDNPYLNAPAFNYGSSRVNSDGSRIYDPTWNVARHLHREGTQRDIDEWEEQREKAQERAQFESDRAHAEAREDSAIQRAVEDAMRAGLNPAFLTGGAPSVGHIQSPSPSPAGGEGSVNPFDLRSVALILLALARFKF